MKTALDKRRAPRWTVQLKATCRLHGRSAAMLTEVWVKDVSEDGIRVEAPRGHPLTEALLMVPGRAVTVQGFFYDDRGARSLRGEVRWLRVDEEADRWVLGIQFTDKQRAAGAFRDFLGVVKPR